MSSQAQAEAKALILSYIERALHEVLATEKAQQDINYIFTTYGVVKYRARITHGVTVDVDCSDTPSVETVRWIPPRLLLIK